MLALYVRGAWPLGFVALVTWLLVLDRAHSARATLLLALAMAAAYVGAVLGWFAVPIADYTGIPRPGAALVLLALAPVLQPQVLAFALVRRWASGRIPAMRAALAAAAWIATEWAVPRVFGDTLGHGLHPARLLRQFADVAGAGGLTLLLLAVNEAIALAVQRWRDGAGGWHRPLAVAAALTLAVASYGMLRLRAADAAVAGPPLRIGLVQASLVDYEGRRRRKGAKAVVREVLDTHFALSSQALATGRLDALVWPETVYPTTFGQPRSAEGALFDAEIEAFAAGAGVPLVFGAYERDGAGEYNVAAFLDPTRGRLGAYRKTRLFPLSEYVPPRLDRPALRRALPWAGTWRPGDGARVFPLWTRDGREIPVAPLICRDDLDPRMGIDAARLGARILVGLSNDSWFTHAPLGARLHLTVAAFRSVETRLPQVRATTNGTSAVIDAAGDIVARTRMGERRVLVAEVDVRERPAPPAVRWGAWLGPLACLLLGLAAAASVHARLRPFRAARTASAAAAPDGPFDVLLLRPWQRIVIGALRAAARIGVLALGVCALLRLNDEPDVLGDLRRFAVLVLLPEVAAAAVAMWTRGSLCLVGDRLVLESRRERADIPLREVAQARPWRLPWPSPGLGLVLRGRGAWPVGIAFAQAPAVARRLAGDGGATAEVPQTRAAAVLEAASIPRRRIDHPLLKFVLFPLVPALPAFRLHQLIAYGDPFGEYYTFGARAYATALSIWWASWAVALVLVAGGLRVAAELASLAVLACRPQRLPAARRAALAFARLAYFIGVPAWLAVRFLAG